MLLVTAASIATPALAQTAGAPAGATLEEIVVTAQKREENLQTVPVAVTAFGAEAIQALRIQNTRDLSAISPGLTVSEAPGGSQTPSFSMRGINAIGAFAGQSAGVSVYIDGVYQGSNTGNWFDLADIERIEVLRGPQGTLFGRNATGGAISLITHTPTGQFGVRAEGTYGNFDQFRTKLRVDTPSWNGLKASFSYLHTERTGDIKNLGAGQQWDFGPATDGRYGIRTAAKTLGDDNTNAFAATVLYDNGGAVRLSYKFDYTNQQYTGSGQGLPSFGFGPATGLGQAIYFSQAPALQTPMSRTRPDAVNNSFTTPGSSHIFGHNLTATWDVTPDISVKNILAYRNTHLVQTTSLDPLGAAGANVLVPIPGVGNLPLTALIGGPPGSTLGTLLGVATNSKQEQTSNETQVTYRSNLLTLTTGFLYYNEFSQSIPLDDDNGFGFLSGVFFSTPTAPGAPVQLINQNFQRNFVRTVSKAVYAQGEVHITDKVDLVLGGRQTWDHKYGTDTLSPPPIPFDFSSDKFTWLVGLNYRPTDDILTYFKASTGFISGGMVGGQVFATETADSYEVGLKSDFLEHRARVNLALYHANYGNLQFATIQNSKNVVLNYGDATANGAEFEGTYIPYPGVTLSGNVSYLRFNLDSINPLMAQGLNTQLYSIVPSSRPKWTATMTAQYQSPEAVALGGRFLIRGDANYKGDYFLSPRGYDDNADGRFDSRDVTYDTIKRPSTWLLNARMGLVDIPIGDMTGSVAIWGRNLLDNKELQFMTWLSFMYNGSYDQARTFGVDFSLQF